MCQRYAIILVLCILPNCYHSIKNSLAIQHNIKLCLVSQDLCQMWKERLNSISVDMKSVLDVLEIYFCVILWCEMKMNDVYVMIESICNNWM